ncbi:MAG: iron-containing alcohol dehydrogenase [Desulfobacterales bacterium]|nr:iron-containing alcohol dehydrogenase [Desulfobacterales bacterium]
MKKFIIARTPKLVFAAGGITEVHNIVSQFGKTVLIITGGSSLEATGKWDEIVRILNHGDIVFYHTLLQGEPTPEFVDATTDRFREKDIDVVLSIGGGSVLDAGKAVSAMLTQEVSVTEFIEGIGAKIHDGRKRPFIAIPTTSGTGSEATKNAVLKRMGANGFKKSFRHDNFVPDIALIDPELTISCPAQVTAACGMDAFSHLLESYLSPRANPMTDALAYSGLGMLKDNLVPACTSGTDNVDVRAGMAYAAYLSGIVLANAGLGVIHGFASVIGGFFDIPHGVVCGALLCSATKKNVAALAEREPEGVGLEKYARLGALFSGKPYRAAEKAVLADTFTEIVYAWTDLLGIKRFGEYGVEGPDVDKIVEKTRSRDNPIELTKQEIREVFVERI